MVSVQPLDSAGGRIEVAYPGCDLSIETEIVCQSEISDCNLAIIIYDANGLRVIDTNTAQKGELVSVRGGQKAHARFLLRNVLLRPGKYFVGLWLGRHATEAVDHVEYAMTVNVVEGEENRGHSIIYPGVYLCRFEQSVTVN
jgi:hypothetical protein